MCSGTPQAGRAALFIVVAIAVLAVLDTVQALAFVPGAPLIGPAWYERTGAMVNFSPPLSDGGIPVTGYTVIATPPGGTDLDAGSPATSHKVVGLTFGTAYTFTVVATNADGTGPASSSSGNVTPRPFAPVTGIINNLVVLIRFSDQPPFSQPLTYYDTLFTTSSNSLKNYYLENSYGALTVNSFFPAPSGPLSSDGFSFQDLHPTGYYKPYNAATNPDGYSTPSEGSQRETDLVANALDAVKDQIPPGIELDSDGDGFVDHICFEVYSTTQHPLPVKFYSRATFDTSGTVTINGKKVGSYTWVTASQDSVYPLSSLASTEIHEMGHSFGYPDLRSNNSSRYPVGDWDIMSTSKPVHSGAYLKHRFTGWITVLPEIDPQVPASYGTYTLNDLAQATGNSYKVKLPGSSEYLVLEYRRRTAGPFEFNLPGSGLCITRVNESAGIWGNLGGPPFFLYYFRPGGTFASDGSSSNSFTCLNAESGRVQFNDASTPPCFRSDGASCGIAIENIGVSGGSTISFDVVDPASVTVKRVISGTIFLGGARVAGAIVSLSGSTNAVTTTDNLGRYVFTVELGGDYAITPTKAYMTFTPATRSYTSLVDDQIQNFAAAKTTYAVSGTVNSAGQPAVGLLVAINCPNGGNYTGSTNTDSAGHYSFAVDGGSSCKVWPFQNGHSYYPKEFAFSAICADLSRDFSEILPASIAGTISFNGSAVPGVNLACPGAVATPQTSSVNGAYLFAVTAGNGSTYTITPASSFYSFTPVSRTYPGLASSLTSQDFSVSPLVFSAGQPYASLQAAYAAVTVGGVGVIMARDGASRQYLEALIFDQAVDVVLDGGYDDSYQARIGITDLQGMVRISSGKVTVRNVRVH